MFPLQSLMAARPQCQVRYCSKCRLLVRGQVGPTGEKCTQPSSNFVADLPPELQTIHTEGGSLELYPPERSGNRQFVC